MEGLHPADCGELETLPACTVVIFGASGDLAYRKLVPALYRLMEGGVLDAGSVVVGTARTPHSDESFRERMSSSLREAGADPAVATGPFSCEDLRESGEISQEQDYSGGFAERFSK